MNTESQPDGVGPSATDPGVRLPPDILSRLDLEALFPGVDGVEVELGSGDGSFLAEYAAQNPGRGFIGVERLLGRLRKLERKAQRRGLSNLRVLRLEAAYVLRWKLASATVSALHVYFPDPWPKRRHWKRRLVNDLFVEESARILRPGGRVFLRTDNEPYFEQMREVFGKATGLWKSIFHPVSQGWSRTLSAISMPRVSRPDGSPMSFRVWLGLPTGPVANQVEG